MTPTAPRVLIWLAAALAWLLHPDHRRWLYRVTAAVIPLLIAVQLLTADQAAAWLTLVQAVLGLTAGGLALTLTSNAWRAWLYAIATALAGLLIVLDWLPSTTAPLLLAVVSAALSTAGGLVADRNVPDPKPPIDAAAVITRATGGEH